MNTYQLTHLKDRNSSNPLALLARLKSFKNTLEDNGLEQYGIFAGLFGIASNEAYLVCHGETDSASLLAEHEFTVLQSKQFIPTVRPLGFAPRDKAGVYVFRWFKVNMKDVDEIASLSATAWKTFEGDFATEVQGLFVQAEPAPNQGEMLLLTWYRNLTVWQESRAPSPEARENFVRRQQLVLEATPIATRLFEA